MKKWFTEHPRSVGETYGEHFKFASLFGCKMILAGLACFLHAIFPFLFKTTGRHFVFKAAEDFSKRFPRDDQ